MAAFGGGVVADCIDDPLHRIGVVEVRDVARSQRDVPCLRQQPASARGLQPVRQQPVVAPPGDRHRHLGGRSRLVAVAAERRKRRAEARRGRGVAERGGGLLGRDARRVAEQLPQQRDAAEPRGAEPDDRRRERPWQVGDQPEGAALAPPQLGRAPEPGGGEGGGRRDVAAARKLERDRAAHRVARDVRARESLIGEPPREGVGVRRDRGIDRGVQWRGAAETGQVAGDDVEGTRQAVDHRSPRLRVVAQAVQQHERWTGALADERDRHADAIRSAARSPIITVGACVLPPTIVGMIDASATRRPSMPCTRRRLSTTASCAVWLMRPVPAGW